MSDPIVEQIEAFHCRRGNLTAERRNRGCTLYNARSGAPVARLRPTSLIDIATLTGAMKVALGTGTGGYFATSDSLARSLDRGHYLSGREIGGAGSGPHFFVGAVENPSAPPLEYRVRRAAKKAMAGAQYLQLQLCYRTELLDRFMRAAHDIGLDRRIALIPSICILRSVGGMRFVANHVPGIDVPPETVRRVEQAQDAEAECFDIAFELATHALSQPGVAGLHFISFRKDAGIAKLCARLGIPPRIERESNGYSASVALG